MQDRKAAFDYVFAVPPDFDELDLHPEKDVGRYYGMIDNIVNLLKQRVPNAITIGITDRKFNRKIIPKHSIITSMFSGYGWCLRAHKIWIRSLNVNLYRVNYTHVLTFSPSNRPPKTYKDKTFPRDVYDLPINAYKNYPYAMSPQIVGIHLRHFTKKGDTVYDPFMGSGTTGIVCRSHGRKYLGSEINKETYNLCLERMNEPDLYKASSE